MEIILIALVIGLAGWYFFLRSKQEEKPVETPMINQKTGDVVETTTAPAWHTAPPEGTKPITVENPLDVNHDGKVDLADVKEAVKKTRTRIKKAADADGDGKVTVKDAKVVAKKAKEKATATVAKARGRSKKA